MHSQRATVEKRSENSSLVGNFVPSRVPSRVLMIVLLTDWLITVSTTHTEYIPDHFQNFN